MPDKKNIQVSVLLCSHNPRNDYLGRTLAGLQQQTLPLEKWELLLVDNNSTTPISKLHNLDWHPFGRHLNETSPGKISALSAAASAASGDINVVVDDDNVLAPDYLAIALEMALAHPKMGVWGGNVQLCFEQKPPEWTRQYWRFLAEQKIESDLVVPSDGDWGRTPVGAGSCFKREVVQSYFAQIKNSPWRQALGRRGKSLVCGEDTDMAMLARDLGLQCGFFKSLHLDHLIPADRLSEEYLLRLVEGIQFSGYVLKMSKNRDDAPPPVNFWWRTKYALDLLAKWGRKRRFYIANKQAQKKARELYDGIGGYGNS